MKETTIIGGQVWVRIADFPDYAVSGNGIVMRVADCIHSKPGTVLKAHPTSGYPSVRLYRNHKPKTITIHRLIAKYFIPNPDNKPEVNHIDTCKQNSVFENLEWATGKENTRHAWKNGLGRPPRGERCGNAKLNPNMVAKIRSLKDSGISQSQIAGQFGIHPSNVSYILSGKTWK